MMSTMSLQTKSSFNVKQSDSKSKEFHVPVMIKEVIEYLNIKENGIYVDGTLGSGGHSAEILSNISQGKLIGLDRDAEALKTSKERFSASAYPIILEKESYHNYLNVLKKNKIKNADGILLDLGLSAMQLLSSNRGFTFKKNEKLDMRFDIDSGINASQFLHQLSQQDLARIINKYSDERFSSKISKAIKTKENLKTTFDLKNAIDEVTPTHKRSKTYARVFQSIRIAVNEELQKLKKFFSLFLHGLKAGSRAVFISYHSIEDRIVKHSLKGLKNDGKIKILTKKPILPQRKEIIINPKSRSAKLRAIEVL